MKTLTVLSVLAIANLGLAKPCGCKHDACYRGVIRGEAYRALYHEDPRPEDKEECSSYLATTVTPSAVTVEQTVTINVTPTSFSSNTATEIESTTEIDTTSVVETDIVPVTTTTTITATTTETVVDTETVTSTATDGPAPPGNPFKRRTAVPAMVTTQGLPTHVSEHCNAQQYASVCHCFGVTAPTITATASTFTQTTTTTVTGATQVIETIVTTVTETTTVATTTTTVTFSTDFITTTVATESSFTTIPTTESTTTTTTAIEPGPTQLFKLVAQSNDPSLSATGGQGFATPESFRGSDTIYYVDFTTDASSAAVFAINTVTGRTWLASGGPGQSNGEPISYVTYSQASYINLAPDSYVEANSARIAKCRLTSNTLPAGIQCRWTDDSIADFWTCASRLNFVQPGYDFTSQCRDASTSYKITLTAVPV